MKKWEEIIENNETVKETEGWDKDLHIFQHTLDFIDTEPNSAFALILRYNL
jgi:hypothetical protein